MTNHNNMVDQVKTAEGKCSELKGEIASLKETLEKELTKKTPDIKEITDKMVAQER